MPFCDEVSPKLPDVVRRDGCVFGTDIQLRRSRPDGAVYSTSCGV